MNDRKGKPLNKLSLAMRHILEARGIDLVKMQIDVYTKAMEAFDGHRGDNEKSDAGPAYLGICNQAIGTLAKYAFPTMTAIKIEDYNKEVSEKVVDVVEIRQRILNDPFAKNAIDTLNKEQIGVPLLAIPEIKIDK